MAKCKPAGALHFGELTGRARTSAPPSAPCAAGPPILPPRCRITYTRAWPIRSASRGRLRPTAPTTCSSAQSGTTLSWNELCKWN